MDLNSLAETKMKDNFPLIVQLIEDMHSSRDRKTIYDFILTLNLEDLEPIKILEDLAMSDNQAADEYLLGRTADKIISMLKIQSDHYLNIFENLTKIYNFTDITAIESNVFLLLSDLSREILITKRATPAIEQSSCFKIHCDTCDCGMSPNEVGSILGDKDGYQFRCKKCVDTEVSGLVEYSTRIGSFYESEIEMLISDKHIVCVILPEVQKVSVPVIYFKSPDELYEYIALATKSKNIVVPIDENEVTTMINDDVGIIAKMRIPGNPNFTHEQAKIDFVTFSFVRQD